jgi:outer membrane protein assembly factor BamB
MKAVPPPVLTPRRVYLGVKGSVIALDADTGQQLWVTHLKGSGFVQVVLDGDGLYATTYGEIFRLDPQAGTVRWHNPLKGFGLGLVSMATEGASDSLLAQVAEQQRNEQASAAASCSVAAAS